MFVILTFFVGKPTLCAPVGALCALRCLLRVVLVINARRAYNLTTSKTYNVRQDK